MTYNKSEIMKRAWSMFKDAKISAKGTTEYNFKTRKFEPIQVQPFAEFLKRAWAEAKSKVEAAIKEASATVEEKIATIEKNLFILSMKDRWNSNDSEQDRIWRNELNRLKAA